MTRPSSASPTSPGPRRPRISTAPASARSRPAPAPRSTPSTPCARRPHRIPKDVQFGALTRARSLAARLLNVSAGEIALATNTSFGLNIAARALPLEPGDIVLVSDREFPGKRLSLDAARRSRGAAGAACPSPREGWPDEARLLERLSDPRVRVLAVSLVQFSSGYKVDLAALSKATRATGTWLVVDAIQGLGQLPVDLTETPVDILATGAQKWLLSPWGSGFFYVRKEILDQLTPPFAGWLAFQGTDDFNKLTRYNPTWHDDSRRFELITLPFQDFAAMNTSLEMILDIGVGPDCGAPAARPGSRCSTSPLVADIPITSPRGAHGCAIVCLKAPGAARLHGVLQGERGDLQSSGRFAALQPAPVQQRGRRGPRRGGTGRDLIGA